MSATSQEALTPSKYANIVIPSNYLELYHLFSASELNEIVQLKRFFECSEGDKTYRTALSTGDFSEEQLAHLKKVGVLFNIQDLAILWQDISFIDLVFENIHKLESLDDLPEDMLKTLKEHPLLMLWLRFSYLKIKMHSTHKEVITQRAFGYSEKYAIWRKRRIEATKSELGSYGENIDHPVLAIELAVGCSIGCYFCAFDAPRLSQLFDYNIPENQQLFREVSTSLYNTLGEPAGHALLYWSTEPQDNPNYIDFMEIYREVTGRVVCTATAGSDETWVRNLIAHYRQFPAPWPRISVLTKKIMHRLHEQFSPDEFRDVSLLMQQRESEETRTKVPGGRPKMLKKLEETTDIRDDYEQDLSQATVPQGSIACVSGFLINMVNKTIKLISPCYTNEKYPYGYRTFDEAVFSDAADFDRIINQMINRKMPTTPYREMPMRFRDDLRYTDSDDGFVLVSRHKVHRFHSDALLKPLGMLIAQGDLTHQQVCEQLMDNYGVNPLLASAAIKNLFDSGLLDELQINCPM